MTDPTNELLAALVTAPIERKREALKVLRGEKDNTDAETIRRHSGQTGPLLLGMGEAAKMLGVSRATLWRILQAGTIKKVELFHGSFRIRREDLERLAEGKFGAVAANGKDASLAVSSRLQKMLAAGARRRDPRFKELMALADGGDEGAAADLFKEFGFERLVAAVRTYGVGQDSSETGVGKTHVGCATCKELGLRPAVVCPKNLIPVWRRTCQAWGLPEPVFILNYEQIRTGKTSFLSWEQSRRAKLASWKVPAGTLLIFDEVHRCAGQTSLNSKLLTAVRRYGIPTLCLSATAAESPLKLKALGYVLRLHDGGESFWKFCATHGCIKNYWGGVEFPKGTARPGSRRATQIERARQGLAKLHESIFQEISGNPPKGTRVRIAELGDAFPETLITAEAYDFGDVQAAYDGLFTPSPQPSPLEGEGEDSPLVAMLRARQAAELLKAPGLAEMAADAVEEGQSVVIFVNFKATLAALRGLIPELSVIEGDTTMDERAAVLRRFGADEVRIVAVNLATAGEGLDGLQDLRGEFPRLTLISPGFSAVQIKQALGRVHRANAKTKSIQRIVFAAGTVEEQACEAVRAKLANMAILNDGDLGEGIAARATPPRLRSPGSEPPTLIMNNPHPSPLP